MPHVFTIRPRGLNPINTKRQRHTAVLLEENEIEFIVAAMWPIDLSPVHYPKFAWEREPESIVVLNP